MIHNQIIRGLIKDDYSEADLNALFLLLRDNHTFRFPVLENGLFPAADVVEDAQYTGYGNVWVRDNFYIAYAHYLNGYVAIAVKNVKALAYYFGKHKWRFEKIIAGELNADEPMNRPHIRFNGADLTEVEQKWAHAQNDALGYFLWLFCKLYNEGHFPLADEEKYLLALFAQYLDAISYWKDEDSGHWEEIRKISASSIGVAVGALRELKKALTTNNGSIKGYDEKEVSCGFLDCLIDEGEKSLKAILPSESIQNDPKKHRRYDAALLFLVFPMQVVSGEMANQIVHDVRQFLQGEHGIRRYVGDSFWSADYKEKLKPNDRTIDFSDNLSARNSLLIAGQEAQWCIFDPVMSIIYGLSYQDNNSEESLCLQTEYFNRSLSQLTMEESRFGGLKCPELYYLENGCYVPNDTVPLLWTQANLWMAFKFMKEVRTCRNMT